MILKFSVVDKIACVLASVRFKFTDWYKGLKNSGFIHIFQIEIVYVLFGSFIEKDTRSKEERHTKREILFIFSIAILWRQRRRTTRRVHLQRRGMHRIKIIWICYPNTGSPFWNPTRLPLPKTCYEGICLIWPSLCLERPSRKRDHRSLPCEQ